MPYNSSTSAYERRAATVIDATPDGDTVAVAIDVKLDQGIDDYVADLNHHNVNGNHYPATSVGSDSRFLKQTPAGVVSWANGVVAADAALKDFSNVANGAISNAKLAAIAPSKITQDASNRFVTDAEKSTWNGALYDKADVESVLTGSISTHDHLGQVLGTVSQTGGVPTGAIIERGSNANGGYARFADGTQICTHTFSGILYGTASGSIFTSPDTTWTFPAAFINNDVSVSGIPVRNAGGTGVIWLGNNDGGTTTSAANFRIMGSGNFISAGIKTMAIGRWF